MKHPFENPRISTSKIEEPSIMGIIENVSEVGYLTDEEGNSHAVPISKSNVLSFSDNIPKDIDADSLSTENCIKNNYNLQEVVGYSTSEESPESVPNLVNFEGINSIVNPSPNPSEHTQTPTSNTELTTNNN